MYTTKPYRIAMGLLAMLNPDSPDEDLSEAIEFIKNTYDDSTDISQLSSDALKGMFDATIQDIVDESTLMFDEPPLIIPGNFVPVLERIRFSFDSQQGSADYNGTPVTMGYLFNAIGDNYGPLIHTTVLTELINGYSANVNRLKTAIGYKQYHLAKQYLIAMKVVYMTVAYFTHAKFEEDSNMTDQIDNDLAKFDEDFEQTQLMLSGMEDFYRNESFGTRDIMKITGNEGYVAGVMMCYSYDPTRVMGAEGFVDSVKEGLRKTGEMIMNMLKSIKDFFFNRKKDSTEEMDKLIESMKSQLSDLEKEDASKYEINQENIGKIRKMLEDAKLTEVASYFASINDLPGLIAAYNKAIDKLKSEQSKMAEAEKALAEAEKSAQEAAKEPSNLSEDASSEEKSLIREQNATKAADAKEKVKVANEKVKEAFMPVRALGKLKGLFGKLFTKKESADTEEQKKVSGNESWMY